MRMTVHYADIQLIFLYNNRGESKFDLISNPSVSTIVARMYLLLALVFPK